MKILEVKNVTKTYGNHENEVRALNGIQVIAKLVWDMRPNSSGTWNFRLSGIEKNRKMWWIMI